MKTILFFILTFLALQNVNAQSVAKDMVRADCDGTEQNLFSDLDNQKVVVLEFVMMNCSPCVIGAKGLKNLIAPYQTSHPNRVKMWSIGYQDSYTCDDMKAWKSKNGLDHVVLTKGAAETKYYGGMGMPTIVVVGRKSHKVFYVNKGYWSDEDDRIKAAIDSALIEPNSIQNKINDLDYSIHYDAVNQSLKFAYPTHIQAESIKVFDALGREVITSSNPTLEIDITNLGKGIFTGQLRLSDGSLITRKFIK